MGRMLHQLNRDAVKVPNVAGLPALVGSPRDHDRLRMTERDAFTEPLKFSLEVLDDEAKMAVPDVVGFHIDCAARRPLILDQLEHRLAWKTPVSALDLAARIAEHPADVFNVPDVSENRRRTEEEFVPLGGSVEVGDREADVVDLGVMLKASQLAPGKTPRCAPPSTSRVTPVRKAASSEMKNIVASAMSASVALRPSGFRRAV